jgi:ketosteroid isomerase-like protein
MADNDTVDTPEERRNVDLLHNAYQAYKRGEPEPFFNLCADDIRFGIAAAPEHFTFAGVRAGKDWVLHVIGEIAKEFAWEEFNPRELIAERDWVIGLTDGKIRDRETGELLDAQLVDVIRMKDGKIVYFVEYFDASLLYRRHSARAKLLELEQPAAEAPAPRKAAAKAKPAPKRPAAKPKAKPAAKPKSRAAAKPKAKAAAKPKGRTAARGAAKKPARTAARKTTRRR